MRTWLWNVLIAIDQLGNALMLGHPDETISSRLGRRKLSALFHGATWPWWCRYLDVLLDWCDPRNGSHALNAIEDRKFIEELIAQGASLIFDHSGRIIGVVRDKKKSLLSSGGADL